MKRTPKIGPYTNNSNTFPFLMPQNSGLVWQRQTLLSKKAEATVINTKMTRQIISQLFLDQVGILFFSGIFGVYIYCWLMTDFLKFMAQILQFKYCFMYVSRFHYNFYFLINLLFRDIHIRFVKFLDNKSEDYFQNIINLNFVFNSVCLNLLNYKPIKYLKMEDSDDGSAFSFGSVQDTFIENVKEDVEIGKLPYNPFLFDLTLRLKSSSAGYEEEGLQVQLNDSAINIFGRKSKKKKQEQLSNSIEVRNQFIAQTMSRNHFSIDINHQLKDLESKKGTYIWIHRNQPKLLQIGDQFLLNQSNIKINSINKINQKIEIQITQTQTLTINPKLFKERLFLIGSSSKCHYINKNFELFHIGIDLLSLTLHNMIEDEDCQNNKGTWMKVKQPTKIQGGDFILVYPYVFEVSY